MKKVIKLVINSVIGAMLVYLFFIMLGAFVELVASNMILFIMFVIVGMFSIYQLVKKEF